MSTAFTSREQSALRALVARIIPASRDFAQPGADDPQIFADILQNGAGLQGRLAAALATLSEPGALDEQGAARFRAEFPDEATLIQTLVAQCYYRDPRVMRALNIAPRPPFPKGYVQEPNDLSLLEPVRQRGEIYRKTDGAGGE